MFRNAEEEEKGGQEFCYVVTEPTAQLATLLIIFLYGKFETGGS
jgi:hypothetical protein